MFDDHDDGGGCGCLLGILLIGAFVSWLEDNLTTILIVVGIIAVAAVIIFALRNENAQEEAQKQKKREKEALEAAEKERTEREAFDRYFLAQEDAELGGALDEANGIIRELFAEKDELKHVRIVGFFDKYLPLVTEIIEAGRHTEADKPDTSEVFARFTKTVRNFSRELYEAEDVIDVNATTLENLAIADGLYDPYREEISPAKGDEADAENAD